MAFLPALRFVGFDAFFLLFKPDLSELFERRYPYLFQSLYRPWYHAGADHVDRFVGSGRFTKDEAEVLLALIVVFLTERG